jgi:hypothetical protein
LGALPARVYIKCGLIETVSRATTAIGPEPIAPVPDGASADSASVLAARESEHQPPRPTRRKRLRCDGRGLVTKFIHWTSILSPHPTRHISVPSSRALLRHSSKSASVHLDAKTAQSAKNVARALECRGGAGGAFAGA